MTTESATTVTLETLAARLNELEQSNAALRARVQTLESEQAAGAHAPTGGRTKREMAARTSRRRLLQLGGAAAAATVAAGVLAVEGEAAAHATPAHADTITFEQSASGVANIAIEGDGTSGALGLVGTSDTNYGVKGTSGGGIGVGGSGSGIGVEGTSSMGTGVSGSSSTGTGVAAYSASGIDLSAGGTGRLFLNPQGAAGAPISGSYSKGEMIRDSNGDLFLCIAGGSPGTWVKVAHLPLGLTSGDPLIVGQSNTAAAATVLAPNSAASAPSILLQADNSLASGGLAVEGLTGSGFGVLGQAMSTGTGVQGSSGSGNGVYGLSSSGTGIAGYSSTGLGGWFNGGRAQLMLALGSTLGAPGSGTHNAGEFYLDSAANLWICIAGSPTAQWVKMAHLAPGATSGGAITFLSTPIRLLDTRMGASGAADTPNAQIQPGAPNTFHLPVAGVTYSGVTIPSGAKALVGNCTVVNPVGVGDLAAYPDLLPLPNTAVMHYLTGQIISNGITIGLGTNGKLAITALGSATDVIIDCQGFIA